MKSAFPLYFLHPPALRPAFSCGLRRSRLRCDTVFRTLKKTSHTQSGRSARAASAASAASERSSPVSPAGAGRGGVSPMSREQSQNVPQAAPLVEVRRGPIVESRHRGHVAAVDGEGGLVAGLGEPETVTYLRSSAKPFQALPLVTSGAAGRFGLTEVELAVACGSHSG